MRTTTDYKKRFWNHVAIAGKDECWIWTGGKNEHGYGRMGFGGRGGGEIQAHRVSLEIRLGRPIKDGLNACHTCNNHACVNPNHLYEGTQLDNVHDEIRDGVFRGFEKGDRPSSTKITEADVLEIRRRLDNGEKSSVICLDYPIGERQIRNIKNHDRWKNI